MIATSKYQVTDLNKMIVDSLIASLYLHYAIETSRGPWSTYSIAFQSRTVDMRAFRPYGMYMNIQIT